MKWKVGNLVEIKANKASFTIKNIVRTVYVGYIWLVVQSNSRIFLCCATNIYVGDLFQLQALRKEPIVTHRSCLQPKTILNVYIHAFTFSHQASACKLRLNQII